jgi:branched-chain amino acid transport system ATP-binding protein
MLQVNNIFCQYGSIPALRGVSLDVQRGEFVALIGANGAGKSTLLRAISGLTPPSSGSITFDGKDISRCSPADIVRLGVAHCPEERKIWPHLSVHEHLQLGAFSRRDKAAINPDIKRIYDIFPKLLERRSQLCGTLSGGEQQMVAVGRALMSRPSLLMLDEPSLGLAPMIVDQLINTIRSIHADGAAIIMVEQSATLALQYAKRAYVLENGTIAKHGLAAELLRDGDVQRAYLGGLSAEATLETNTFFSGITGAVHE